MAIWCLNLEAVAAIDREILNKKCFLKMTKEQNQLWVKFLMKSDIVK